MSKLQKILIERIEKEKDERMSVRIELQLVTDCLAHFCQEIISKLEGKKDISIDEDWTLFYSYKVRSACFNLRHAAPSINSGVERKEIICDCCGNVENYRFVLNGGVTLDNSGIPE